MSQMDWIKKALFALAIFLWSAIGGIIVLMNLNNDWPGVLPQNGIPVTSESRFLIAETTSGSKISLGEPKGLIGEPKIPLYGWMICRNLGVGPVPGVKGSHARFQICTGSGWRVNVYCLQPELPNPPMNRFCSVVNGNEFWCGNKVQLLRQYQIVNEPPRPTRVRTRTRMPTRTATFTPTVTETPGGGSGGPPDESPTPTTTQRPNPGGDSYLNPLTNLFLSTGIFLLISGSAAVLSFRKK